MKRVFSKAGVVLVVIAVLVGYWLLPIHGTVEIQTGLLRSDTAVVPRLWVDSINPDEAWIYVQDVEPLVDVQLTLSGTTYTRDTSYAAGDGPWMWRWRVPRRALPATASFFHECAVGCQKRLQVNIGAVAPASPVTLLPTKLGVVFANPNRDWHQRAAWSVDLTYSALASDSAWGIDGLTERVYQAKANGLQVIVRINYDFGQSLPPRDDQVALSAYLAYCKRLAHDDRLAQVDAFMVGSGYNSLGENTGSLATATTPEWYARIFNGYGLPVERSDNVVQTFAAAGSQAKILVGPVTPWNTDQTGAQRHVFDQAWLNYFHSVVAAIDSASQAKSAAGYPRSGAAGFALQAPGHPELARSPANEPQSDLQPLAWNGAQAGFRVYQDWLTSINSFATTRGLPVFITSTNTWTNEEAVPPLQNYPAGWLTAALAEINQVPQIQALCWFVDQPFGDMWFEWSLSQPQGKLFEASEEFDQLLQN